MYGRNAASGTYAFFKSNTMAKGDYKNSVKEQPGSSAVVQGVATDKGGIGYSGIGYKTADVSVVPLAKKGDAYIDATPDNAYAGKYPLARFLWLSVNYKPGSQLDPLRREFIERWSSNDKRAYLASMRAIVGWGVAERIGEIEIPQALPGDSDGDDGDAMMRCGERELFEVLKSYYRADPSEWQ